MAKQYIKLKKEDLFDEEDADVYEDSVPDNPIEDFLNN